jgi:hypothetical protein
MGGLVGSYPYPVSSRHETGVRPRHRSSTNHHAGCYERRIRCKLDDSLRPGHPPSDAARFRPHGTDTAIYFDVQSGSLHLQRITNLDQPMPQSPLTAAPRSERVRQVGEARVRGFGEHGVRAATGLGTRLRHRMITLSVRRLGAEPSDQFFPAVGQVQIDKETRSSPAVAMRSARPSPCRRPTACPCSPARTVLRADRNRLR